MLQSSNQYLRPDYLAAPNAMDAKSSPLALLAQTCSAIGADTTNPKLLAANIEKSTKSALKSSADGRDKSSPVSSQSSSVSTGSIEQIKSSFKPYESTNNNSNSSHNNNHMRDRLECEAERATNLSASANNQQGGRVRTPKTSGGSSGGVGLGAMPLLNGQQQQQLQALQHAHQHAQQQQRCDSNQSATSQRDSPATGGITMNGLHKTPSAAAMIDLQQRMSNSTSPQRVSSKESPTLCHTPGASQMSPSAAAAAANQSRLQAATDSAIAAAKEASYVKALHAAAAAAGVPTTSSGGLPSSAAYYGAYPGAGSSALSYPMDMMTASALMSPHHPMFKAAALHPYLNYARLKGIDPTAMMTPNVCRDPYCTGCPSSPHFLNLAAGQPCPAGCPQCEGKSIKSGSSGSGSGSSAAAAVAAAAASSYHAQLAALAAASQLPYVCSWIGADATYCGKRFGTSDELFQHLRTHTASLPDSVLSAAAAGGIPPTHPLFQRTYPTPPLSPLSAARYHPYGKPSMLPPPLASAASSLGGLPMPPHPALAQYFAPYSLYGPPRMGSSHP